MLGKFSIWLIAPASLPSLFIIHVQYKELSFRCTSIYLILCLCFHQLAMIYEPVYLIKYNIGINCYY